MRPLARLSQSIRLALVALALTGLVSVASSATWIAFYNHQPLWVEHAAYGMAANIAFADALATGGYWTAAWTALAARHPLEPALIGVWPRLLRWPHAHVLVTGATLYVFLQMLVI